MNLFEILQLTKKILKCIQHEKSINTQSYLRNQISFCDEASVEYIDNYFRVSQHKWDV